MKSDMAGQVRHLKVKDGRHYVRIAVPAALLELADRTLLTAPLGGERCAALKMLPEQWQVFSVSSFLLHLERRLRSATTLTTCSPTPRATSSTAGFTLASKRHGFPGPKLHAQLPRPRPWTP